MSLDFPSLCEEAQQLVQQARWQEASELLQAALSVQPTNTEVMDHLAECFINLEEMEKAIQLLEHSIRVAPDSSHLKYMYMAQIMGEGYALHFYNKGLELLQQSYLQCNDPTTQEELRNEYCAGCCAVAELYLTDLCDEEDAPVECEKWLEKGRQCNPNYPELYQFLGSLRISQQREAEARPCLEKAVELLQDMEEDKRPPYNSQVELAKLLLQVQHLRLARDVMHQLLQQDDERPIVWLMLATCYRLLGRHRNALRCLVRGEQLAVRLPGVDDIEDEGESTGRILDRFQEELADVRREMGQAAEAVDPRSEFSDSDGEGEGAEGGEAGEAEGEAEEGEGEDPGAAMHAD